MSALVRPGSCPGLLPAAAVREALVASTNAWTLFLAGRPAAMWGVCSPSYFSSHGHLWAIVSDEVLNHKILCARFSKKVFENLHYRYQSLEVIADASFETANRWIQWLGFKEVSSDIPTLRRYTLEN